MKNTINVYSKEIGCEPIRKMSGAPAFLSSYYNSEKHLLMLHLPGKNICMNNYFLFAWNRLQYRVHLQTTKSAESYCFFFMCKSVRHILMSISVYGQVNFCHFNSGEYKPVTFFYHSLYVLGLQYFFHLKIAYFNIVNVNNMFGSKCSKIYFIL